MVCTHPHNDHAAGLIKLVEDRSLTIRTAWMHDIRNHVKPDALRRASSGGSSRADAVKQVVENTEELARAFSLRRLNPFEPFAGARIADYPSTRVLGPSLDFYHKIIREFTDTEGLVRALGFASLAAPARIATLSDLLAATPAPNPYLPLPRVPFPPVQNPTGLSPLAGLLSGSSVQKNPTTQPFNNTSAILGILFAGEKFMFTSDAGSDSLDCVSADWAALSWMQVPHHGSDGNLSQANIERFCPKVAYISARGSTDHPSRAIVNGLVKAGALVCSTHSLIPGHLWCRRGNVPARTGYGPVVQLKSTANRPAA